MNAVFNREFFSYFRTPVGFLFMGLFLFLSGIFFVTGILLPLSTQFAGYLSSITFIFLLCVPILTMKSISEELRLKTDQLLLTSSVPLWKIVGGKFGAATCFFLLTLAFTLIYLLLIVFHGSLAGWEIVGAYVGFVLMGMAFIAVGIFVSSTTESQASAAIITFCFLLLTWIIDYLKGIVPSSAISGFFYIEAIFLVVSLVVRSMTTSRKLSVLFFVIPTILATGIYFFSPSWFHGLIGNSFGWISLNNRYMDFALGLFKLQNVIYYLSFTIFFLCLTTIRLEEKRWN